MASHIHRIETLSDIDWATVYERFGMKVDYNEFIKTINWSNSNLWIAPVIKGITCNKVVLIMKKHGIRVWPHIEDLDANLTNNDRYPVIGSYVIGFRRTIEADEENKNLSANILASHGHKGITLLERLILGVGYFWTTGQHLDIKNVTLTTGSLYLSGNVPSVRFDSDDNGVYIYKYNPDDYEDFLRSRSVIFPMYIDKSNWFC